MASDAINLLRNWFLSESRNLPWRGHTIGSDTSPYAVWVSEIMLQQTQVSVVIPYFLRWMQQFPTIETLANAHLDEVLKAWEGLGYYARARNLHEGAKFALLHFNGKLPDTKEALLKIKGLGSYTSGAILNFAFHKRYAAVDGNVMRVCSRYFGLLDDIAKLSTVKKIESLTLDFLPEDEPWVISEALIELGATVCKKLPKCIECPLKSGCKAFLLGMTAQIPFNSRKTKIETLYRSVAVVIHQDKILIRRGGKGKVMEGLCEFPYLETPGPVQNYVPLLSHIEDLYGIQLSWTKALPQVKHSFTRYSAILNPHVFTLNSVIGDGSLTQSATDESRFALQKDATHGDEWVTLDELKKLPFSSGHKRIFDGLT